MKHAYRNRLNHKTLAMLIGIGAAFALIARAPYPLIWLSLTWTSVVCLTLTDVTLGICLVLILNPLLFMVRNAAPTSIILAGAQTEWIVCLFGAWLINRETRWPRGPDVVLLFVFMGYAVIMAIAAESLDAGLLGLRAILVPALVYFVVRDLVRRRPNAVYAIMASIIGSAGILSLLSILWYWGNVDSGIFATSPTILGGGRTVLGYAFQRMGSLIGGGPSNASLFTGTGVVIFIGYFIAKGVPKLHLIMFGCLAVICAYASFLTLSRSVVLLWIMSFSVMAFTRKPNIITKVVLLSVVIVLAINVVFGTAFNDSILVNEIKRNTFVIENAMPKTTIQLVFGGGLNAASGGLIGRNTAAAVAVDGGWVLVLAMMGCVGAALIGALLFVIAGKIRYLTFNVAHRRETSLGIAAGAAAAGLLFGSVHMAVIMRPAIDVIFYTLTATTVSIAGLQFGDSRLSPASNSDRISCDLDKPRHGGRTPL